MQSEDDEMKEVIETSREDVVRELLEGRVSENDETDLESMTDAERGRTTEIPAKRGWTERNLEEEEEDDEVPGDSTEDEAGDDAGPTTARTRARPDPPARVNPKQGNKGRTRKRRSYSSTDSGRSNDNPMRTRRAPETGIRSQKPGGWIESVIVTRAENTYCKFITAVRFEDRWTIKFGMDRKRQIMEHVVDCLEEYAGEAPIKVIVFGDLIKECTALVEGDFCFQAI